LQKKWEEMDPEEVAGTTMRYSKSVFQLEKGLPPNNVVPKLKEKVDKMKERVTISCSLNLLIML
jgi:hypothetical protein